MNNYIISLLNNDMVISMYVFGSKLYNTYIPGKSDVDIIAIVKNEFGCDNDTITVIDEDKIHYDINIYTEDSWLSKCKNNHINALEIDSIENALSYSPFLIMKETKRYEVKKDLIKLRESISATVSNSWAKANKKLNVEKDYNPHIAKKSLWHCFRILMYGIQVAKHGKIIDFTEANYLYDEIVNNECNDWKYYKSKYQEKLNNMRSEFRTYMEDEWREYKKID